MKKILISPYSRELRNGELNPKNYPFWQEVVYNLKNSDLYLIQIGVSGEKIFNGVDEDFFNRPLKDLGSLVTECTTWASVDNFFPHFCSLLKKPGVVVFGKSDPLIFGYKENVNLLKDRSFLRPKQFDIWEAEKFDPLCFVPPEVVTQEILKMVN